MTTFEIVNIVIALCVFVLTIQQGIENRKQAKETQRYRRLSYKPRLCSRIQGIRNKDVHTFTYSVSNNGLGPAIIKNIQLFLDGKEFRARTNEPMPEFLKEAFKGNKNISFGRTGWLTERTALSSKENHLLGEIIFNNREELNPNTNLPRTFDRLDIRIEHLSIYEEFDVLDTRN